MSEAMRRFVLQEEGSPVKKASSMPSLPTEDDEPKENENRESAMATSKSLGSPRSTLSSESDESEGDDGSPPSPKCKRKRPSICRSWLTADEQKRYDFFTEQRNFVKSITDMCEKLRSVEPSNRKDALKTMMSELTISPNCFIPLCKSTDVCSR